MNQAFDIKHLTDTDLGHMVYVLTSPSYKSVFEPYLQSYRNSLNKRLLDPTSSRNEEYPDDFLRGGIVAVDSLLAYFELVIETMNTRSIDEVMKPVLQEDVYNALRASGNVRGSGQVLQPEDVILDPDEEY